MSHQQDNGDRDYNDEGPKDDQDETKENQTESENDHTESEESQTESELGANMKKKHPSPSSKDTQQCSFGDNSTNRPNGCRYRETLNNNQKNDDVPPTSQTVTHASNDNLTTSDGGENAPNVVGNFQDKELTESDITRKPSANSAAGTGCTPKKIDSCTGCYKEAARALCIQCNLWLGTECLSRHQARKDALAHTVLQREAVQICPSHSRPCSHFCIDCQNVICPVCTLGNCSSHTTQDISLSLDEMRLFLVHHEGLIDKYFQYIRQRQNTVFDDAKRAVIVQTGTLISMLMTRSRALEDELECARVRSLSLLGRQEDAYNATLHRFLAAMPQTPKDCITTDLLGLLPVVKVIPETTMTVASFQPRENLSLGHLDIFKQTRDPIMMSKLPHHPCCDLTDTPSYTLNTISVPHFQTGTKAEISGFCDEGNQYFTTQTGRQKTRCHAAVQTIEDSKKQNDSTFAFHFNTIPASQPLQKPKALHSNNSSNANMSQKGWGLFQTNEQSQNTFNTLFPTGANIRQSQNSVCSLIGTSSVSTNSQNDSTLLFEATSGVKHSLSPVSSDTSQSKNGTCTPIGSSAATKTSQQDASFVAGSSPDNKQPQLDIDSPHGPESTDTLLMLNRKPETTSARGEPTGTSGRFGGFGASSPPTCFTNLFNDPKTSSSNLKKFRFGRENTEESGYPFGSPRWQESNIFNTPVTNPLFGNTKPGGLCSTIHAQDGTTTKFTPPNGSDTIMEGDAYVNISTQYQCITAMEIYENKSLEELRHEDYTANRSCPQTFGSVTGTTICGLFGGFFSSKNAQDGTTTTFTPPSGSGTYNDTIMEGGSSMSIITRHQCITAMKMYENKSLEELRHEDYAANRSRPQTFGSVTGSNIGGTFRSATSITSSNPFANATSTNGSNLFGSATSTTGSRLFGSATSATGSGLFGNVTSHKRQIRRARRQRYKLEIL